MENRVVVSKLNTLVGSENTFMPDSESKLVQIIEVTW